MNYIIIDLEWNQPRIGQLPVSEPVIFDSEIVEIGAVKLDEHFEQTDELKVFIKPSYYPTMNGTVSRLTKISDRMLESASPFPEAFNRFLEWCGPEFALMTWGPTDLPVLMDNMLMYGISTNAIPVCYDLQRMFGHEVMRDDKQCSLERAMEILNLPSERAHDALNDCINTAKICSFLDLDTYMDEYRLVYADYAQNYLDRLCAPGEIDSIKDEMKATPFVCPYCGETGIIENWVRGRELMGYGRCPEGDEFLAVLDQERTGDLRHLKRVVYEMNDDFWDSYQDALEQQ